MERHISEKGFLLPISSSRNQGCQRLHPLASSLVTPLIGRVSLAGLQFSALCPNLTAWFSSRGFLPVTHLFDLSALIVLSSLQITTWQLVKAHGVTRNEPKIHSICYITLRDVLSIYLYVHLLSLWFCTMQVFFFLFFFSMMVNFETLLKQWQFERKCCSIRNSLLQCKLLFNLK